MSRQPAFEATLGDWLEDGPVDASDVFVGRVLAVFPTVSQRRGGVLAPRRFVPMRGYARAMIAIAAVVVVVAGAVILLRPGTAIGPGDAPPSQASPSASAAAVAVSSPTPSPIADESPTAASPGTQSGSPTSQPSPSPLPWQPIGANGWTSYTSKRNGFSIRYPADWRVIPAIAPWAPGTQYLGGTDGTADIFSPNYGADDAFLFNVSSQPLAPGTTAQDWLAANEANRPPTDRFPAPEQLERVTIDGKTAYMTGGQPGCGFTEANVFDGGRAYVFNMASTDRATFDTLVSSAKLEPKKASDAPASY